MRVAIILILIFISLYGYSQVKMPVIYHSKAFDKAKALYHGKAYIMEEILKMSSAPLVFVVDPSAASQSGELTTLVYNCPSQKRSGLVLGFFGDYWNDNGVIYTGFAFKEIPKDQALELLKTISTVLEDQNKYLKQNPDNNNVVFVNGDLKFLIYLTEAPMLGTIYDKFHKIRIFWNGFDSEWDAAALLKTKKAIENLK